MIFTCKSKWLFGNCCPLRLPIEVSMAVNPLQIVSLIYFSYFTICSHYHIKLSAKNISKNHVWLYYLLFIQKAPIISIFMFWKPRARYSQEIQKSDHTRNTKLHKDLETENLLCYKALFSRRTPTSSFSFAGKISFFFLTLRQLGWHFMRMDHPKNELRNLHLFGSLIKLMALSFRYACSLETLNALSVSFKSQNGQITRSLPQIQLRSSLNDDFS